MTNHEPRRKLPDGPLELRPRDGDVSGDLRRRNRPPERRGPTVLTEICGDERTQREPLYEVVDGDALDQLYAKHGDGRPSGDLTVEFTYLDHRVRLDSEGEVEIRPPSDATVDRANQ